MNKSLSLAVLVAAIALAACGKKEETTVVTPVGCTGSGRRDAGTGSGHVGLVRRCRCRFGCHRCRDERRFRCQQRDGFGFDRLLRRQ